MKLVKFVIVFLSAILTLPGKGVAAESWKQLLNRADSLCQAVKYDSAVVIGNIALEKARAEFGSEDTTVALALHRLGFYHWYLGHYLEAESLTMAALRIREKEYGAEHLDVAASLNNLANVYRGQARYKAAESLYTRALQLREKALGPDHLDVATSLNNLALLYVDRGKYSDAETLHQRALTIREKALDPNHPDVAASLNNLGNLYDHQSRTAEAESLYNRALSIREKALGSDHPDVATSLANIGVLYSHEARYSESEALHRKALAIREATFGDCHPTVSSSLNNLANTLVDEGRFADAEPLYKRALVIDEKVLGPDHSRIADGLNNLAVLYIMQSRQEDAEPLLRRSLAIYEKNLGSNHPNLAASLNNLGLVDFDLKRYSDAEPLFKRAIAIDEKALGPEHPYVAGDLNNLALVYKLQERYADAGKLFERTLAIYEKNYGAQHPMVSCNLANLANTYVEQGRYDEAEPLLKRGLAIDEKILGPQHPDVALKLRSIAMNQRRSRRPGLGLAEAKRAFDIVLRSFRDNANVLAEQDALKFSQSVKVESGTYFTSLVDLPALRRDQLDEGALVILESKGIVSDGIMERERAFATEKDSVTLALVASVRSTRSQIAQMYASGPEDDTTGGYKRELDSLSRAASDIEANLYLHSASFQRRQQSNEITVASIDSALPLSTSLVEYLKWDYCDLKSDSFVPRYLALVMNKGKDPEIVNLGDASGIEVPISHYLKHMKGVAASGRIPNAADMAEYQQISRTVYEKIWKPLEKRFRKGQTILVGLDGSLNLLSLAGVMDDKGTYLTEQYTLHHLSSGRDLLRLEEKQESGHGLFALGDPDFDASIADRAKRSSEQLLAIAEGVEGRLTLRNVRSGCGVLSDMQVADLPFTRTEVQEVSALWPGRGRDSAEVLFGAQASEDMFKTHGPGKKAIHLATHGYYLTGQCADKIGSSQASSSDGGTPSENPLLQSGLLMAGSNLHGAGCDSAHCEDGILSASEVAGMDLSGTDVVVLSACETGLGEVKQGEGVYGLRRAFQMAGARTVVSALWSVSDQITAEMMSWLYTSSGQSLAERMRQMQLEQLKKLRAAKLPDHPFLWAGFVATGDWR